MAFHSLLFFIALIIWSTSEAVSCSKTTETKQTPFDVKAGLSTDLSVWPNTTSYTNSDSWLIQHHDNVKELRPRVLVIDFRNGKSLEVAKRFVYKVCAALAEGSKYHGYKDPSALPQLKYSVVNFLDLRDSSGNEESDKRPHNADSTFNEPALFNDGFAKYLGYKDSTQRYLRLGELFDKGIINECWVIGNKTLYEGQGRVREYDSSFHFTGAYYECVNACYDFGSAGRSTSVTIRLGEINLDRGAGCATHAFGHAIERMVLGHNPYLVKVASRFFNFNLNTRFGAPFPDLYVAPYYVKPPQIFSYGDSGRIIKTVNNYLPVWANSNWGVGCGSVHFSPNSTFQYDTNNNLPVKCTCENYGMKNGPGSTDLQNEYDYAVIQPFNTDAFNDCGGEWQIYLRQNIPGYNSGATGDDGKPMKSWWPFLFY